MAAKPGVSFGFTKKAGPKRVVEALKVERVETKELITDLAGGVVTLEAPRKKDGPLKIACKNPLKPRPDDASGGGAARAPKPKVIHLTPPEAAEPAADPPAKLGGDDAEALRELRLDAQAHATGEEREDKKLALLKAEPILMRAGSRRVRGGGYAPDELRDAFDRVPVESFGEALLRGMGYDPAKHTTKPVVRDKQRDYLLGLGAKLMMPAGKKAVCAAGASEAKELAGKRRSPDDGLDKGARKRPRADDSGGGGGAKKAVRNVALPLST